MSNSNFKIPEPTLPEHALIRDSAPVPELSAGFKQRVMSDCAGGIAKAARVRRWKVSGTVAAVCSLALLLSIVLPNGDGTSQPSMTSQQEAPKPSFSSDSLGYPTGSSPIVVDGVTLPKKDAEKTQINELMETLDKRQQMFDANMLPNFQ